MNYTIRCPICGTEIIVPVGIETVGIEPTAGGDIGWITVGFRHSSVRHTCEPR